MINIATATTKELVEFYNAHADKAVSKFADRKTAEKRVFLLIEAMPKTAPASEEDLGSVNPDCGHTRCPACNIHLSNGVMDFDSAVEITGSKANTNMTKQWCCMACDNEWGEVRYKKQATSDARSDGIARSWKDKEVAEKRAKRHFVRVNGQEFNSVRAAFIALNLPLNKHIKFRMELKAEGSLNAFGRKWEALEV
jgi:hypothetical protein